MFPNEGTAGKFKMKMYRGLKKESEHLHKNFASDPGDYGCGEYWRLIIKSLQWFMEM